MQRLAPKTLLNCFNNDFHDCMIFLIFKNVSYASSLNFSQKKEIYSLSQKTKKESRCNCCAHRFEMTSPLHCLLGSKHLHILFDEKCF